MTKIIFNNEPPTLDPYILDWNISLYSKEEEELAVFQFCKLTEYPDSNDFHLSRGKVLVDKINLKDTYYIKMNVPDFVCELQEVNIKAISSGLMPGKRIILNAISGTYKELVK